MAKLGDIATYINGYAFKPQDWSDEGIPIIRIQDLTGNSYQANRYNGEYASKYEVNDGDVLISWSASLGVYVWHGEKAVLNQHIFKVVFDKERISKDFFVHQVGLILENAASDAHGATMKHLTKPVFDALPFYLPPYEKQCEIAGILDKVTSLISLRKQQLDKLDELVKARFVEMFENSSWPNTSLNDICSEIVDCPHSTPKYEGNLEHPAIRTTEIKKGYIDWDSMKYVSEEEYQKRIKSLKPVPGDIVYGREGTYGNAAIIPDGYEFCLGQRVMLFRPNKTKCISAYVLYAILSDRVKRQADEKNVGATVPHVNVADAKQFDVVLPPLELQNQFAAFVERVDKQKQTVQQSLEKLELMKKALMQEYFGHKGVQWWSLAV